MIRNLIHKIIRPRRPEAPVDLSQLEASLPEDSFVCQLRTIGDFPSQIKKIETYNQARSIEAGKPIRDSNRVLLFQYALQKVEGLPTGDYAEVGTYRGMTASLIWAGMSSQAKLYCFDTFEGFNESDLNVEANSLDVKAEQTKFKNTNLQHVTETIAGGAHPRLNLIQGYFPESFADLQDRFFRFVHLDCDLYQPIKAGLELFWPRLVPGGVILVHDYLSPQYPGTKNAVDEFCHRTGAPVMPWCDRLGTAILLKAGAT
ncbi:MAG: class I SAM-dependent methyltransferase [Verrucomicrobiales bacterium]|nr:class I SAM-dependent methyltransferase [Verrucomicrobiales bacterium]